MEFLFPLQARFPGLNLCSFVQTLFMALMEPQHHPGPSRAPWGSHLGFFTFQQFLPDVTLCPGHGAGSVPVPSAAALWVFGDCSLCPTLPNVPNPLSGSGKPFPCVLTLYPLSQIPLHVTIKSQSFSCPGPALIFSTPFSRAALCHLGKHCRN